MHSTKRNCLKKRYTEKRRRNGAEREIRGTVCALAKAKQKRPAQNSERNVILNDNKIKIIIV